MSEVFTDTFDTSPDGAENGEWSVSGEWGIAGACAKTVTLWGSTLHCDKPRRHSGGCHFLKRPLTPGPWYHVFGDEHGMTIDGQPMVSVPLDPAVKKP